MQRYEKEYVGVKERQRRKKISHSNVCNNIIIIDLTRCLPIDGRRHVNISLDLSTLLFQDDGRENVCPSSIKTSVKVYLCNQIGCMYAVT